MEKELKRDFSHGLENPEFYEQVREAIARRLDELAADPTLHGAGLSLDMGEAIRSGNKVESARMIHDAISGVGQDFRLTWDEIDGLKADLIKKRED